MEVENILEEVEKRAYDNILEDYISLWDSILHELSTHLIDLPHAHSELIDWGQPSILHVDEFPIEEVLLRFIGAKMPHKQPNPPSTYVCTINPKGYFGETTHSSCKEKEIKDHKKPKEASKRNNLIKEEEYEYYLLPPQDFRLEASSILVEESRPIKISLTKTP